jgi:hypothetical protein
MGSMKKIIPTALTILLGFLVLHFNFGLVEYRFFVYYTTFILGIITASIYTSNHYKRIRESAMDKHRLILPIIISIIAVMSWIAYTNLSRSCYSTFISTFGTTFLSFIVNQQINFMEFVGAIIWVDIIILTFISFILSIFYLIIRTSSLILNEKHIQRALSLVAYSTYGVYLFHRPFLATFDFIMLEIFNINMLEKSNFYLIVLSLPILFVFAFLIQKAADKGIFRINEKIDRITVFSTSGSLVQAEE